MISELLERARTRLWRRFPHAAFIVAMAGISVFSTAEAQRKLLPPSAYHTEPLYLAPNIVCNLQLPMTTIASCGRLIREGENELKYEKGLPDQVPYNRDHTDLEEEIKNARMTIVKLGGP